MCGISGILNFSGKNVDAAHIGKMLQRIKHRGPDDEGVFIDGNIGLGHVRLSIIDLSSAGHQPMFSGDKRYCIIFNGEIYNYIELKNELRSKYEFKSQTDTEVLLASFLVWGEECLSKLNGDFAFVIYDTLEKKLFGARDRFGIKPFYYFLDKDQLIFASEIKAILPLVNDLTQNDKAIFEYLVYNRTDQSDQTFFNNVLKLKHGHCFTIKNGKIEIKKWYNLSEKINYPTSITPQEFREELIKAVSLRLRSDVPVGICLSGGIDSSAITSILYHDLNTKGLNTFSAVFEKGNWADESPYIDEFKGVIQNMYNVTPTAQSFYDEFQDFVGSQCEPIPGDSPYSQYKVMQLAKGKVSVTLDGQGADEMLGGYNYFYGSYFKELFKGLQLITLLREVNAYYQKNTTRDGFKYFVYFMMPEQLKVYAGKRMGNVSSDFYHKFARDSTLSADLYNPSSLHDSFMQHFEFKLEHLLKWDDLNSMNFSIESRVPFLDHNLVEKVLSLPPGLVLKNGIAKSILRESVRDILPEKIYTRYNKLGFSTPSDEWFRTKLFKDYILGMLNSDRFKNRGYFDISDCKEKYKKHLEGKINASKEIWKWINLDVWFQKFIEK